MTNDSVALVSGGLDSVTMLHRVVKHFVRTPIVLLFDYNQRSMKEADCAKYHADLLGLECRVIKLDLPKPQYTPSDDYDTYIPVRNMVFLSLAAAVAEGEGVKEVYTGFHEYADMFWDTTPAFVLKMNSVLNLNERFKIRIKSPLQPLTKAEIICLGQEMGVDYAKTWSCYENQDEACGTCPICQVRLKTFGYLGIDDPLPYKQRL